MEQDYSKIILDLLNRIQVLEEEVKILKANQLTKSNNLKESSTTNKRDKTRYLFEGKVYLKNQLILSVLKSYTRHASITCDQLKRTFGKSLQGSIGVVEYEYIAKQRGDYQVRYFAGEDEILRLVDGNMLVCSQWDISNINRFITRAKQLGFCIEAIEYQE